MKRNPDEKGKLDFERILPLACAWARDQEKMILEKGRLLLPGLIDDAKRVGVVHPDRVRTLLVSQIPVPEKPVLRVACEQTRLITKLTAGLTLRYGIFIRSDCADDRRLYVHELAHVAQYERLGGMEGVSHFRQFFRAVIASRRRSNLY